MPTPQELLEQKIRNMQVPQPNQGRAALLKSVAAAEAAKPAEVFEAGAVDFSGQGVGEIEPELLRPERGVSPADALATLRGRRVQNVGAADFTPSGIPPLPPDIEERRKDFRERAQANIRLGSVEARERRLTEIRRPAVEAAELAKGEAKAELDQKRAVELAGVVPGARAAGDLAVEQARQAGAQKRSEAQIKAQADVQEAITGRTTLELANKIKILEKTGKVVGSEEREQLRKETEIDELQKTERDAAAKNDFATVAAAISIQRDLLQSRLSVIEAGAAKDIAQVGRTDSKGVPTPGAPATSEEVVAGAQRDIAALDPRADANNDGTVSGAEDAKFTTSQTIVNRVKERYPNATPSNIALIPGISAGDIARFRQAQAYLNSIGKEA